MYVLSLLQASVSAGAVVVTCLAIQDIEVVSTATSALSVASTVAYLVQDTGPDSIFFPVIPSHNNIYLIIKNQKFSLNIYLPFVYSLQKSKQLLIRFSFSFMEVEHVIHPSSLNTFLLCS